MVHPELSIAQAFKHYFDVKLAATKAQKADVYRIRYSVYCQEFGYEPAENFPDGLEFDEYDEHSLHCLITHKSTGMPAGCVRMVPRSESKVLPLEQFCSEALDNSFIESLNLDTSQMCEISRLAVDSAFRRRSSDHKAHLREFEALDYSKRERRTFPLIAVAAFLGATALTAAAGRTHVFAMMEPFLPRMLQRSGIFFQCAGKEIDYHGLRAPYFIRTENALSTMKADLKELYELIEADVRQQYMQQA